MTNKNKKRFTSYDEFFQFVYDNFELINFEDFLTNQQSFEEREKEIDRLEQKISRKRQNGKTN